jgi:hypothetical protein
MARRVSAAASRGLLRVKAASTVSTAMSGAPRISPVPITVIRFSGAGNGEADGQ